MRHFRSTPLFHHAAAALVVMAAALFATLRPMAAAEPGPAVVARFDWTMPDRFHGDWKLDDSVPAPGFVHPATWRVTLNACASRPFPRLLTYTWEIDGPGGTKRVEKACRIEHDFPAQGVYPVKLTVATPGGWTATTARNVVVRDLLIVDLGDSIASGEGNPDVPRKSCPKAGTIGWDDTRCHRSLRSGAARAALTLEKNDPRTSVTFVSLACSGARVADPKPWDDDPQGGLLDPYKGQEGTRKTPLPPQVEQLRDLVGDRRIDTLILTAGANDAYFSEIVHACREKDDCSKAKKHAELRSRVADAIGWLPTSYYSLAGDLRRLQVSAVYITEYPGPLRGGSGKLCDNFLGLTSGTGSIRAWEAKWAEDNLVHPLNEAVRAAAEENGWVFVGGIAEQFRTHGYCADDHWVVRAEESHCRQGNFDGTLHPNAEGHEVYRSQLVLQMGPRVAPLPSVAGTLDTAGCQGISGWAWDQRRPGRPVYVDVYADGQIVATVLADQLRPDLSAAGIGDGRHGFVVPIPDILKDGAPHRIDALVSGTPNELSLSPKTLRCGGYLDRADCSALSGWAWDSGRPDAAITVALFADGNPLAEVTADRFRPDLPAAGIGDGRHAFEVPLPVRLLDGEGHEISARFKDAPVELRLSPRAITCSNPFVGFLDFEGCSGVSGWAWDSSRPNQTVSVDIYDFGRKIATVSADRFRQDLKDKGIGDGRHGFEYNFPSGPSLFDPSPGVIRHQISVKIAGTDLDLHGSPAAQRVCRSGPSFP